MTTRSRSCSRDRSFLFSSFAAAARWRLRDTTSSASLTTTLRDVIISFTCSITPSIALIRLFRSSLDFLSADPLSSGMAVFSSSRIINMIWGRATMLSSDTNQSLRRKSCGKADDEGHESLRNAAAISSLVSCFGIFMANLFKYSSRNTPQSLPLLC